MTVETKLAPRPQGRVEAVIATTDVVDRDGDVLRAGAIADGTTVPVCVQHVCTRDAARKVGTATTRTKGRKVVVDARFNMGSKQGRAAFAIASSPDAEWSWAYRAVESRKSVVDGREVRELLKVELLEVSVVLEGASVGTATVGAKCSECAGRMDPGLTEEQVAELAGIKAKLEAELPPWRRYHPDSDEALLREPQGEVAAWAVRNAWGTWFSNMVPPRLKFFNADSQRRGYYDPKTPDRIYAQRGLSDAELVEVIGHESAHYAGWPTDSEELANLTGRLLRQLWEGK